MLSSRRTSASIVTLPAALLATLVSFTAMAQAPAPNTTEWESEALKLRLFYPSDLVKGDTEDAIRDGRLTLPGVAGATDPKLVDAANCLRPVLLLRHPPGGPAKEQVEPTADGAKQITVTQPVSATLLLAELDVNCLNAKHDSASTTLLNDMAEIVTKVPGMRPVAQSSTYTVGWQKVHMAAAQGLCQVDAAAPSQLYTLGLSTNWNSHLLVWYFTSNSAETLDRITKTAVRFGNDKAAPLYPLTIGNASR